MLESVPLCVLAIAWLDATNREDCGNMDEIPEFRNVDSWIRPPNRPTDDAERPRHARVALTVGANGPPDGADTSGHGADELTRGADDTTGGADAMTGGADAMTGDA